jgi:hypothetical protein
MIAGHNQIQPKKVQLSNRYSNIPVHVAKHTPFAVSQFYCIPGIALVIKLSSTECRKEDETRPRKTAKQVHGLSSFRRPTTGTIGSILKQVQSPGQNQNLRLSKIHQQN